MEKFLIKLMDDSNELNSLAKRLYHPPVNRSYVQMGPNNVFMINTYVNYYQIIKEFEVFDDDVYVCGYPKSGTRWTQEMVWLIGNNLDYKTARELQLGYRIPMLESDGIMKENKNFMANILEMSRPRFLKTHLHWSFLPDDITSFRKKPKMIVILRSPEDVCVSQFHQNKATNGFIGTFEEHCTLFLGGRAPFGPIWKQILSIWEQRNNCNMIFIKYKQMKEDLPSVIREVAKFLEKDISEEEITQLVEYLSFNSMKQNKSFNKEEIMEISSTNCNPYVRKGVVGEHKSVMTPEIIQKFKEMNQEMFGNTDITFD